MAIAVSSPDISRHDDVRALRFRFRTLTFSGNYQDDQSTTQVEASDLGLKLIAGVIPLSGVVAASDFATSNPFHITVAADRRSFGVALYEGAAGGSPLAEKTDNEAFLTGATLDVIVVGF
jgi:hypothetical protein